MAALLVFPRVLAAVGTLAVGGGTLPNAVSLGHVMPALSPLALALGVAAVVAFTVNPHEPLTRLFALLMFTCGILAVAAPLASRGYWVGGVVETLAQGLSVSLFARFCLAFAARGKTPLPRQLPWYRTLEQQGPLVPLVLCLLSAALASGPRWLGGVATDVQSVGLAFGLALGLGCLAWAFVRTREGIFRAQLFVVALGAAFGALPPLVLNLLPQLLVDRPVLTYWQSEYGLLAMPICLGFALIRWRTVSLLGLIDRVSVYVVLAVMLLACYGALALGLAKLDGDSLGSVTTLVSLTVAIVVATTFAPLRDRIQRAVDTVLYRDYYDLGRTLQRFSQSLATVRDQHAVVTSLLDDICDTLNLSGAALIQLPGGLDPAILRLLEPEDLVARRGYSPLEVRRLLVHELRTLDSAVVQDSPREPVISSPFAGCAALVALGSGTGGDMSALLLVGAKRGGGPLRAEDRALLGTVAHQAATALENATLIGGLRTTLAQLRRSTEQLEDARAELELLLREMVDADERQRASLARDIHDVALQDLMFVSRSATYCMKLFGTLGDRAAQRSPDAERLAKELGELTKVAASAETELRNVITGLYPAMIESLGLPSALETLAEEVSPTHPLSITVEYDPAAEQLAAELDKDVRLHLYRIAQEAIRNASKHAEARHVVIELHVREDAVRVSGAERQPQRAALVLTITDDGAGIKLPIDYVGLLRDRHLGLASMRDRAERVGGQLAIRHCEENGTRIEVSVRLQRDALAPSGWAPARTAAPRPTPRLALSALDRTRDAVVPANGIAADAVATSITTARED